MIFFSLEATEAFLEYNQTSMVGLFVKKVDSFMSLTIFAKSSPIEFWLGSKYSSWQYCLKKAI